MDSDLDSGEDTSDGRIKRIQRNNCNPHLIGLELMIKQEMEIKDEPIENVELHENQWPMQTSTANAIGTIELERENENRNGNDGNPMNLEGGIDRLKEEIKSENEENAPKKESNPEENAQQNNGNVNDSVNKRQRSNEKVKVKANGRNRILAKKRNMARASKTRKVRAKPKIIHKCSQCNYTTSNKSNLTAHIRTHTGEKPFGCGICAKSFTKKQNLNMHKKTHLLRFNVLCSKCGCGFENENEKTIHETKCKRRQFECHLCKYSNLRMVYLKRHMRTNHTGEKPFECSICSKTFVTKINLSHHSRIHTEQLPFNCTKCGRRFVDENEKQLHQKRCNCRRFECYICRYNTFQMYNLKLHMRLNHTGVKPFRCGNCDKTFVQKSNLNQHSAVHAKQRPIRCAKCLRRFKDENVKMAHEKRCNRRHYQCYLCKINRQQLRHLKFHLQKSHIQSKMH